MEIRQLLVEARGCRADLNDADGLLAVLREAASSVGAREVGATEVRFVPHGVTAVIVLAESHLLLSTWPEYGLALVDVLLCNPGMDPENVWGVLEEHLRPEAVARQSVVRRVSD